jgi:hypothetical protein
VCFGGRPRIDTNVIIATTASGAVALGVAQMLAAGELSVSHEISKTMQNLGCGGVAELKTDPTETDYR